VSRKPETTFIGSVHKHLPMGLYHTKMHNPYTSGIADVYYSGNVADIWVEYKFVVYIPKTKSFKVNLSELQAQWLRDRASEGRRVYVIQGTKLGGIIMQDLEWENTFTQAELTPRIVDRKTVAAWLSTQTTGHYAIPETPDGRRKRHKRLV